MGGFYLAQATVEDLPALAELERLCFTHPWSPSQIAQELAPGGGAGGVLALCSGSRPRRTVRAFCAYRVVLEEMHVLDLAVAPAWRRRGLARFLLRVAMRRAARAGARRALLEVRAGNREALALYEKLGFARRGARRDYYSQPVEDAVLLEREPLPSDP